MSRRMAWQTLQQKYKCFSKSLLVKTIDSLLLHFRLSFSYLSTSIKECDNGTYGKDCTNKCGNCQQQPCHHTNGTCLSGCSPSYKGETCKEEACLYICYKIIKMVLIIIWYYKYNFFLQIKNPTNIVAIVVGVLGTLFCGGIILIIGLIYRRFLIFL